MHSFIASATYIRSRDNGIVPTYGNRPSVHTQAVYNTGMKNFIRFLSMYNLLVMDTCFHMCPKGYICYVAHCHNMLHLKYSTIKLYLADIRMSVYCPRPRVLGLENPLCGPIWARPTYIGYALCYVV